MAAKKQARKPVKGAAKGARKSASKAAAPKSTKNGAVVRAGTAKPMPTPKAARNGVKVHGDVVTCLTYSGGCAEAVKLYTSLFDDGKILEMSQWGGDSPVEAGKVMHCIFRIGGMTYRAFDGGDAFEFAMGASISCTVETQAEIDRLWSNLLANGGEESMCGWLIDRWGMWWQIIPANIGMYIADPSRGNAQAGMQAMLKMRKLDIAGLEAAYYGKKGR